MKSLIFLGRRPKNRCGTIWLELHNSPRLCVGGNSNHHPPNGHAGRIKAKRTLLKPKYSSVSIFSPLEPRDVQTSPKPVRLPLLCFQKKGLTENIQKCRSGNFNKPFFSDNPQWMWTNMAKVRLFLHFTLNTYYRLKLFSLSSILYHLKLIITVTKNKLKHSCDTPPCLLHQE